MDQFYDKQLFSFTEQNLLAYLRICASPTSSMILFFILSSASYDKFYIHIEKNKLKMLKLQQKNQVVTMWVPTLRSLYMMKRRSERKRGQVSTKRERFSVALKDRAILGYSIYLFIQIDIAAKDHSRFNIIWIHTK